MWTCPSKCTKINDAVAGFGSYNSTPLWSKNEIFSTFIFVPGTFPHLTANFRHLNLRNLKNEMRWRSPFETVPAQFRSPVII